MDRYRGGGAGNGFRGTRRTGNTNYYNNNQSNNNNNNNNNKNKYDERACYRCGEVGHLIAACPIENNKRARSDAAHATYSHNNNDNNTQNENNTDSQQEYAFSSISNMSAANSSSLSSD